MASDETVAEIANMYRKMSLIELLTEENSVSAALHRRMPDPLRKAILEILRSEIERRLQ